MKAMKKLVYLNGVNDGGYKKFVKRGQVFAVRIKTLMKYGIAKIFDSKNQSDITKLYYYGDITKPVLFVYIRRAYD